MKAISLWQPWASLWLTTSKVHETRSWNTNHRGCLLVHAAKRSIDSDIPLDLLRICWSQFERAELPIGAIIGCVDVIDCLSTNCHKPTDQEDRICGDFRGNRFMWKRGAFHVFDKPIPYKGRQGLFDVPADVLLEHAQGGFLPDVGLALQAAVRR